jgi:hypothetical protein
MIGRGCKRPTKCAYPRLQKKVSAINLFVALASRQEFQTRTRKPRFVPASAGLLKKESPAPEPSQPPDAFPVVCKRTQCIICIRNERLPYEQRTRTFKRVSNMWDHVENVHLSSARVMFRCTSSLRALVIIYVFGHYSLSLLLQYAKFISYTTDIPKSCASQYNR